MTPLDAALARLGERHPKRIDLGLTRIQAVLEALGNPQRRLPRIVHVAGTNGKGSTVAFLESIARSAGHRVHTYTSPHLVRFSERFRLNGIDVDDDRLVDALERVEAASGDAPLSFFEATTAAGFLLFSETPADWLILEVGLGGRLDATNVIADPAASVITPIGLDHREFLGDTLTKIAREKAGILKKGSGAIIGPQSLEAGLAIEEHARGQGIALTIWGRDFDARLENGRLTVETQDRLFDLDAPGLMGRHQIINAGTAVMAALTAGISSDDTHLSRGMTAVNWPGRLQRMRDGRAADLAGGELWIDGAHNPAGAAALALALADITDSDPLPLVMICGMQANKDAKGFFAAFDSIVRHVVCVTVESAQTPALPDTLADIARSEGLSAETAPTIEAALKAAQCLYDAEQVRVIVCGSLYLVAEILNLDDRKPRQLTFG
jgi:dihydrofolate synthase / folylpolyglutamate synthase